MVPGDVAPLLSPAFQPYLAHLETLLTPSPSLMAPVGCSERGQIGGHHFLPGLQHGLLSYSALLALWPVLIPVFKVS